MKIDEINAMSEEQLQEEIVSLKKELFNLRIQRSSGQAPKPHLFGRAKRDIARIKTILRQKVKK